MATERDVLVKLNKLFAKQAWEELAGEAIAAVGELPTSAYPAAYAAHALRQLNQLAEAYDWAQRAVAIDANNLFAVNRLSLLGNLTGHFEVAWDIAVRSVDLPATNASDVQNLANTIVNGIHASAKLDKIADAIEVFSPLIVKLDYHELHFNSACLYGLAHDERMFTYVGKALATGKPKAAFEDADFDSYRFDPRFAELLARDWDAEKAALERAGVTTRAELAPHDFIDGTKLVLDGTVATERNAELELAIGRDLDDEAGYLVYSDWLQERGNVRAGLMLASRKCDAAVTESERMLAFADFGRYVMAHGRELLGPLGPELAKRCRVAWRYGFVERLVFDTGFSRSRLKLGFDAAQLLRDTLALPVMRFLCALRIGDIVTQEELDYGEVVEVLRSIELPHVRELAIAVGDYQMSWSHLDITDLPERLPALRDLVLGAGDITLGELDLPQLERLAVRTGGLGEEPLQAICAARWPALRDLELWFGSTEFGAAEVHASDLAPILRGYPQLRRLALMNAEFTDEIVHAIAGAPVLRQLAELDLSLGTMTDAGAEALLGNTSRFLHLDKLVLDDNCISPRLCDAITNALPRASVAKQKDPDDRYVSVGE